MIPALFPTVSAYQYPSENQNQRATLVSVDSVSAYQYPSENQNPSLSGSCDRHCISLSISIREPKPRTVGRTLESGISLSISIREPKHLAAHPLTVLCISLSISIREPKRVQAWDGSGKSISLSISIREPKPLAKRLHAEVVSAYQYPSENQNCMRATSLTLSVSAYQYPSENQNWTKHEMQRLRYQLINIHQRTKTGPQLHRKPGRISLSISIREPKRFAMYQFSGSVSAYQYPSENQNRKIW